MEDREKKVYAALKCLGLPYEQFSHAAAYTMQDCAVLDERIDATHCKNLFLCNRQGTQYYLLLIRADKKFRTAEVSPQIGCARLSFGSAENLLCRLDLEPGAVSPMGLLNDVRREILLLVDEDLRSSESICFHPNVNTASIVLRTTDFFTVFLPFTGHPPQFVSITSYE